MGLAHVCFWVDFGLGDRRLGCQFYPRKQRWNSATRPVATRTNDKHRHANYTGTSNIFKGVVSRTLARTWYGGPKGPRELNLRRVRLRP